MAAGAGHRRLLRAAETGIAGGVCSDVARHVATKTVGSAIDRCDAGLAWYAHGEAVGGGIFALRRPRPYSRHLRGFRCDASPPTTICDHMGINGNGEWEDNDASRRVVVKIVGSP